MAPCPLRTRPEMPMETRPCAQADRPALVRNVDPYPRPGDGGQAFTQAAVAHRPGATHRVAVMQCLAYSRDRSGGRAVAGFAHFHSDYVRRSGGNAAW